MAPFPNLVVTISCFMNITLLENQAFFLVQPKNPKPDLCPNFSQTSPNLSENLDSNVEKQQESSSNPSNP